LVITRFFVFLVAILSALQADCSEPEIDEGAKTLPVTSELPVGSIPDLRQEQKDEHVPVKRSRNYFVVPIPMSSPTFGTGLILGGAYFYRQTEAQKAAQPPSFTGVAAGYTDDQSWFAGIMQQSYWGGDRWRFNAEAGYVDLQLELESPQPGQANVDWLVSGSVFQAAIYRRIRGHWYLGLTGRYLEISQELGSSSETPDYNLDAEITSPGVGLNLQFDTRDVPTNAYSGHYFQLKAIFADQEDRPRGSYQSYYAQLRSYHHLRSDLVLAWEVSGCAKDGVIPLWDTCRLDLRGFPVTDYLGTQSLLGQAEARWHFSKRWGAVAFAGAGWIDNPFSDDDSHETVPSYGVGLRFMVLESQRINMRLDYGRSSHGDSAIYLAVGEAF
jgi:hypothetical protein